MRIQKKIMMGAVIFVLCAAAAYAQIQSEGITVSSTPIYMARNTGRAELAGSIRFTASSVITLPAGITSEIFTVNLLGTPITNTLTTAANINPASTWTGCAIGGTVDQVNGVVTITCPVNTAAQQWFELVGVRVSVDTGVAITSGAAVAAQIASTYNTIISPEILPVLIRNTNVGMVPGSGGTLQSTLATGTAPSPAMAKMFLKEGFATAFKTLTEEGAGATQATQILITVAGLPAGVTVAMSQGAGTTASLTTDLPATGVGSVTFSSTVPTQKITITGDAPLVVETLELDFVTSIGSPTLPLAATTYTATATLTPNDAALSATGGTVTSSPPTPATYKAPKFSVTPIAQAILTVVPSQTSFLIPYATTAVNYNTGIAIANSTSDPFGGILSGSAIPQNATITFYFYPNDGTTIAPYTTAATSPGTGLTSAGVLNSGSTYVVLLSQLLNAAAPTRTAAFSGYIMATIAASNCHATAFISDFAGKFTSFSPGLVIPNPAGTPRSTQQNEALDF